MKQKTFYISVIAILCCCMTLFSSAEQNGSKCDSRPPRQVSRQKCSKQVPVKAAKPAEYDLSPLSLFLFNI
jgi:hypothetical protein